MPLSILFVSSEVYPFAKESGIADVSYSLPIAIKDIGHDIRVMLPKYGIISERKNKIHEINRLRNMLILMDNVLLPATVKSSSLYNPRTKVQAYITTSQEYFDEKKGIYHDPRTWKEYDDNMERFVFFNKSVIETCRLLGWYPDVIHMNNWHTSLVAAMARERYPEEFKNTAFVLTMHNLFSQGSFNEEKFHLTELPESAKEKFMHNGEINFLKAGIEYADFITTVSKTYADEILNEKVETKGLSAIINEKKDKFRGILNGIDLYSWNPQKDNVLKSKFKGDIEDFKYDNKVDLINHLGFDYNPKAPLIGMIPNIGFQKGVPLLIEAADELFKEDIQMVLLGQGNPKLKAELKKIADKYPDKFKVIFDFDQDLSRRIEAGCDLFLMPSEFEPCGLNLMYSLHYGTVPVIRYTGGMTEIAEPLNEDLSEGDTFTFDGYNAEEFLSAIKRALIAFTNKDKWLEIIKRGMDRNFAWNERAKEYVEIYNQVLRK